MLKCAKGVLMGNQQRCAVQVRFQRLPMGNRDNINVNCIVYSPNKYRETEGIKEEEKIINGFM